ncbi:uncharacterized protein K02A2.6-like [Mercenaria mercenaria]|uniref:uncharacterized protein K02A2.6-like n=1 Tax=Mercenaria mercenaria TaxID=6596 RepID=UPI00234EC1BA|nr:uncharacterized protein K02A2.6-like [Mercenaria mercenaria]
MIKSCHACQLVSPSPQEPPVIMTKLPTGPFKYLEMDFTGPYGQESLLVVIDYYTRYPLVAIMKSTTSRSIINQLSKWFSMFGYPNSIRTDNAPNLCSDEFKSFLYEHGIKHCRSTPYFPRSNRLVENFNKSLKKCIHTAISENRNWRDALNTFLLHFRATPHCTTNFSPAFLMFNREIKTKIPQLEKVHVNKKLITQDRLQKDRIQNWANKDKSKGYKKIKVGEKVLIRRHEENNKMSPLWGKAIYKFVKQTGTAVNLISESGVIYQRNVSQVKSYIDKNNFQGGTN